MVKSIRKTKLLAAMLAVISIADIITALMVKYKQPYFNESNPIYLMTNSFFVVVIWKLLIVGLLVLFLVKWYNKPPIYARYLTIVYIILIILAQITGIKSNIVAYNQEPAEVKDIPKGVRAEVYEQKYSPLLSIWVLLFLIFIVWWQIESEQLRWKIAKF